MEEIIPICKESMIWEDIQTMENGLNTVIHGFGDNVSGGQINRICLARAIFMKKPIIKPERSRMRRLRFAVRADPARWPIGTMPISAPSKKIARPIINRIPPTMNCQIVLSSGAMSR